MKYYGKTSEKIEKLLYSDFICGLSEKEARKRLSRFGKNIIFDNGKKEPSKVALKLIYDPVSILLLLAALICFSYTSTASALLIISVWALNLFITIAAYYKSEDILYTVKSYGIPKMRVLRDSKVFMIDSRLIVPGDILFIEAGDIICADCKIISSENLSVYENDLCGTDHPTQKYPSEDADAITLSDMHGMLFASSSVLSGHGVAIVTACAEKTEIVSNAGLLPICGKHEAVLFSDVKRKCRTWGLITSLVAFIIFIIKMLTDPSGIFDAFMLVISLMGASMSESLLPLTQIAVARGISNSAQVGNKNRVIIKNAGAIDYLRDSSVFVATDEITEFENMDLLNGIKEKGIRAIICAHSSRAFALATKYGASVCRSLHEIEYAGGALAVFVADSIDQRLELINSLQDNGETVGALTTRLDCIRMLSVADVAFTYGKFKYKTKQYSRIYLENFSGQQNQILSRVSDVICEENMLSTYRAVSCARGIYSTVSSAASYLIMMQSARVILCIVTLFSGLSFIRFTQILAGGMLIDLFAVMTFAFLGSNSFGKGSANSNSILYSSSAVDALILSASVILVSYIPHVFGKILHGADSMSVSFLTLTMFAPVYMLFITQNRITNKTRNIIVFFSAFLVLILLLLAIIKPVSALLYVNVNLYSIILSLLGVFISYLLLMIRRHSGFLY